MLYVWGLLGMQEIGLFQLFGTVIRILKLFLMAGRCCGVIENVWFWDVGVSFECLEDVKAGSSKAQTIESLGGRKFEEIED